VSCCCWDAAARNYIISSWAQAESWSLLIAARMQQQQWANLISRLQTAASQLAQTFPSLPLSHLQDIDCRCNPHFANCASSGPFSPNFRKTPFWSSDIIYCACSGLIRNFPHHCFLIYCFRKRQMVWTQNTNLPLLCKSTIKQYKLFVCFN